MSEVILGARSQSSEGLCSQDTRALDLGLASVPLMAFSFLLVVDPCLDSRSTRVPSGEEHLGRWTT